MHNKDRRDYGIDSYVGDRRTGREISSNSRNNSEFSRSDIMQSNRLARDYNKEFYTNDVNNEGHEQRIFSRIRPLSTPEVDSILAKRKLLNAYLNGQFGNSGNEHTTKQRNHHPNECGDYYHTINQRRDFEKEHYRKNFLERNNPVAYYKSCSGENDHYSRFTKPNQLLSNQGEHFYNTTEFDERNNYSEHEIKIRNANSTSNDVGRECRYDRINSNPIRKTYNLTGNNYEPNKKLPTEINDESNNDTKLTETRTIPNGSISSSHKSTTVKEQASSATSSLMDRSTENKRSVMENKFDKKSFDSYIDKNYEKGKEKSSQKHGSGETLKSEISSSGSVQSDKGSSITVRSKKIEDINLLNRKKSKTLSVIDDGIQKLEQNCKECDLYQITMAYAYWKSGKIDDKSVFDLFFRNNPFHGEFTIFAGLEECLKFLDNFHYSDSDIEYLRQTLPEGIEDGFFEYLRNLTAHEVILYAIEEGSVAFPRVPLIKIEGPLIIVQLLETTLLTLVNYASLMATNAARYRMVAGKDIKLLEFGLRRAQGPDGGLSASKYSYVGGFDGTSNVLAGKLFNIPVKGTHAHAYITSFTGIAELKTRMLRHKQTGVLRDLLEFAIMHRDSLSEVLDVSTDESSEGELAAMVSFAIAFPDGFMALVDTYDVKSQINTDKNHIAKVNGHSLVKGTTIHKNRSKLQKNGKINGHIFRDHNHNRYNINNSIGTDISNQHEKRNGFDDLMKISCLNGKMPTDNKVDLLKCVGKSYRSGLLNFCAVALALNDLGYRAVGIRIDSGDLAYLSCLSRETFGKVANHFQVPWFNKLTIVASNDINEDTILSLNEQGHKIDCFGIGTHLVTCQRQPALGCVYKLVEINGQARIKLSQDVEKVTMPGNKNAFRLYSADDHALIDLMQKVTEPAPLVGVKVLCRHPFQESKRAYVIPSKVELLYKIYWQNGKICQPLPSLEQVRQKVQKSLKTLRNDHKRTLNPTPYKVAVSDDLYNFIHDLWLQNAPIGELS